MTDYQKNSRIDLAALDALDHCKNPVNLNVLHELVCPRTQWVSIEALAGCLANLEADGYVHRTDVADSDVFRYHITCKGRARLCASDAKAIFGERIDNRAKPFDWESSSENLKTVGDELDKKATPVQVAVCDVQEPRIPLTALICLDEDELNDWWNSLDVELKADAFAQFALHMHEGFDSHVYIEPSPARIPVAGTIGALPTTCCYCGQPNPGGLVERQHRAGQVLILRRFTCASQVCMKRFEAEADAIQRAPLLDDAVRQ